MEVPIDPKVLADAILALALDKKATDPALLEVGELVGYTDYMVIVSGRNPRQVRAIAEGVRSGMKQQHGILADGMEGTEANRWVLVDYNDVVLHVFHEDSRDFYDIEGLWSEAQRLPVPDHAVRSDDDDDDDDDDELPLFTVP